MYSLRLDIHVFLSMVVVLEFNGDLPMFVTIEWWCSDGSFFLMPNSYASHGCCIYIRKCSWSWNVYVCCVTLVHSIRSYLPCMLVIALGSGPAPDPNSLPWNGAKRGFCACASHINSFHHWILLMRWLVTIDSKVSMVEALSSFDGGLLISITTVFLPPYITLGSNILWMLFFSLKEYTSAHTAPNGRCHHKKLYASVWIHRHTED